VKEFVLRENTLGAVVVGQRWWKISQQRVVFFLLFVLLWRFLLLRGSSRDYLGRSGRLGRLGGSELNSSELARYLAQLCHPIRLQLLLIRCKVNPPGGQLDLVLSKEGLSHCSNIEDSYLIDVL